MSVHSCESADKWETMGDCKVRVDGVWKQCSAIYAYVDGAWHIVWTAPAVDTADSEASS